MRTSTDLVVPHVDHHVDAERRKRTPRIRARSQAPLHRRPVVLRRAKLTRIFPLSLLKLRRPQYGHQVARVKVESVGQPENVLQGNVAHPTLDRPGVGGVQVHSLR